MAVINANCVAIYYLEGSSSKRTVSTSDNSSTVADTFVINSSGEFRGVAEDTSAAFYDLTIAGAATNSVIEISNAVENVARDGSGGVLQESTQTWSVTADGLIQDSNDTGTDIFQMAIDKDYVVVKWSVGEEGSEVEYAGQALIESVSLSGSVDEIATYNIQLTGVDDIYPVA